MINIVNSSDFQGWHDVEKAVAYDGLITFALTSNVGISLLKKRKT